MSFIKFLFVIILGFFIMACTPKIIIPSDEISESTGKAISYLALGDSYTIGEDVPTQSSFPMLLRTKLEGQGFKFTTEPKVIAKTGWTCDDLLSNIEKASIVPNSYDLVSVLIGVNDQYRGFDIKNYPGKFTSVLRKAIDFAGSEGKVIILSIPDYSVTPFGGGSQTTAKAIAEYNKINKQIAYDFGIKYVDLTSISQRAKTDLTYLAPDRLHPSEKMYAEWVNEMIGEVLMILKK